MPPAPHASPRCTPKHGRFASNPAGAAYGPRVMRDYEFVWMARGDARYTWGEQTVDVPHGAVALCRPGETDGFTWDPHQRSLHGYIHFDIDHLPRHWPKESRWPLARRLPDDDVFRPMLRHLLVGIERGSDAGHLALTLGHLLSCYVLNELTTQAAPAIQYPEPVPAVLDFIRDRLRRDPTRPITLDALAEAACLHPASLCRRFKQATGRGPVETVRLARLDLALQHLTRSTSAVKTIAADTGFASPYHFSRCFKEAFGQSPTDIRKAMERGNTPPLPRLHEWF